MRGKLEAFAFIVVTVGAIFWFLFWAIENAPVPFIWVYLTAGALFLYGSVRLVEFKATLFNISVVFLFLFSAETYYVLSTVKPPTNPGETCTSPGYYIREPVRGTAPSPDYVCFSKKYNIRGEKIYEVKYTINSEGLRVSGNGEFNSNEAVLFFGGSFTFGEGVEDIESLPYQFSNITRRRYRVFNLGFHGYGPQQMLRVIETDWLDSVLKNNKPVFAVFQTMSNHMLRAYGIPKFTQGQPKYRLKINGDVEYAGVYYKRPWFDGIMSAMKRSYLFNRVKRVLVTKIYIDEAIDLYMAIVDKARDLLKQKYGVDLLIIIWSNKGLTWDGMPDADFERLQHRLKDAGHNMVVVEDDILDQAISYHILDDGHPNALAHRTIAQYIAQNYSGGSIAP